MCDRVSTGLKDAAVENGPIPLGAPRPRNAHEGPWNGLYPAGYKLVRRSPHQLISGRVQPVPRSLMRIARARGSKGDGTILYRGVFQPCRDPVTHPPWIS